MILQQIHIFRKAFLCFHFSFKLKLHPYSLIYLCWYVNEKHTGAAKSVITPKMITKNTPTHKVVRGWSELNEKPTQPAQATD